MALKDWDKSKHKSGWSFTGKTDFNKGRKYQKTDIYVYKKGWFRDKENFVVVKINNKIDHSNDEFKTFNSEKEALNFAKAYMRKN